MNIVVQAERLIEKQFNEVADDAVEIMKGYAPKPSGAAFGKGSHSTGATEESIKKRRIGQWVWEIAPNNDLTDDRGKKYMQYAEQGRGTVVAKHAPLLIYYDGHGRKHKAKQVRGMRGWHFVHNTAAAILSKYG